MSKIVASIPCLGLHPGGWEREKEIYVLGLAADLRGAHNQEKTFHPDGSNTVEGMIPELSELDAMQFVVVAASNIFKRIRAGQPLSLSGSGILLYQNHDPGGMLALHFAVIESDGGHRRLGGLLQGVLNHGEVRRLVQALQVAVSAPAAALLIRAMAGLLPEAVRRNRDDILFSHSHSGFAFDGYGIPAGRQQAEFCLGNDRVHCTLRLRNEGLLDQRPTGFSQ